MSPWRDGARLRRLGVLGVLVAVLLAAAQAFLIGAGGDTAPHDVVRRWLSLCLLAGLIGGLAFALVVLTPAVVRARQAVLTLATCAGVLAMVAGLVDLQIQARRSGGDGPDLLFDTHWGRWWLVREGVLGVLVVLVGALRTELPPRSRRVLWSGTAVLTVAAVTTEAVTGHAAAAVPPRPVAVAVLAAHALAAFVWVGGLAALAVAWLCLRDAPEERAVLRGRVRDRFVPLAASGVALVVATGLASAGRELGTWRSLVDTGYGRTLLFKSVLFLIVVAVGLRSATHPLSRRLLIAQTAAGLVVLLATGILVETPPPRPAAPAAVTSISRSGTAGDLLVTLSVTPGRAGPNGIAVIAASGRRPPPAPIDGITVDLGDGSGPTRLPPIGSNRYAGTGRLPAAGAVIRATVIVQRGGTRLAVPLTWTMPPASAAPRPSYRDGLAPVGDVLGLVLLGLAAVAWLLTVRRRRRPAASADPRLPEPKILEDIR